MTLTSSQSTNTCGTGTRDCGGFVGRVLCLWIAASTVYSRSTWCAVWDTVFPAGFFRSTKRTPLLAR